ncbi:MAG: peptidyl-prolyl cis-trans isomerase [candidate division Zixibacteria bacterium]|nr:peptidyl-prolyl cis-trans isomerase [candidate division Zixibacteria bacterium]
MRTSGFVLTVVLTASGLSGCAKKTASQEPVVAEVGGRPIKMREITDYLASLHVDYPSAAAELKARKKYLDKLIENEMLIVGGYGRALDADIGIIEQVDNEKANYLIDELYRTEVLEKAPVKDADVKEFYDHMFDRIRFRHIVVKEKLSADSIVAALKAGADFGDLAEKHSLDPQTRLSNGDIGFDATWSDLPKPLADVVFGLADGELGGPVQTAAGWEIVKFISRRKLDHQDMETVRASIESIVGRRRQQQRRLAHLQELKERAHLTFDPDGLAFWRARQKAVADTAKVPTDQVPAVPDSALSDADQKRVMYRWGEDHQVTLGDFCRAVRARPTYGRPHPADQEELAQFAFQNSLMEILHQEALRLRLDESPIYKDRVHRASEALMADRMRNVYLIRGIRVNDPEVRAFFDAHPDSFAEPPAYHVREVLVFDEKLANDIARMARQGTPVADLARQYTQRSDTKSTGGDLGWVSPTSYPDLYKPASQLKPGEVAGPIAGGDQFSIIQLIESRPAKQQTFEDVQNVIFEKIQKRRQDSVLQAYIDSMKVQNPIIVHDDVLASGLKNAQGQVDSIGAGS